MECYNCNSKRLVYDKDKDAYVCLDCNREYKKQYFFISHSHLDIEKVRIIRNIIEETFFYEPILFFLKCVSDEEELKGLLEREIYERIWFVYCRSENAEKSVYVQQERNYLAKLIAEGKKINRLDVELDKFNVWDKECFDYIRRQIEYKIRKTKIFISYSHHDIGLLHTISQAFMEKGLSVWTDRDLEINCDSWEKAVQSQIKAHSYKDGVVLALITQASLNSRIFIDEIKSAVKNQAFIIPVIIGEKELCYEMIAKVPELMEVNHIACSDIVEDGALDVLIQHVLDY